MSVGWPAGERDAHERRVAGPSVATGPQEHHSSWLSQLGLFRCLHHAP